MGAGGYIISQKGAKYLLKQIKKIPIQQMMAIDHVIFEMFIHKITVYQVSPAVCMQSMFLHQNLLPSQLEKSRQDNAHKTKFNDNIIQKVNRIFKRLKRSIGKRTFYKKVPFR